MKNNLVLYLKFLEALREKTKADTIRNLLLHSVSAHLEMHVAVGYSKYFEFQLVNPSREEQLITIEISDHDLR